jgi:hypothetical protein
MSIYDCGRDGKEQTEIAVTPEKAMREMYSRLVNAGFGSATSFIEAHPGETFKHLARWKVRPRVMPILLMDAYASEASDEKARSHLAIEVLVRSLRDVLPNGWTLQARAPIDARTAAAPAAMRRALIKASASPAELETADRAWKSLLALQPPQGWVPRDTHDHIVMEAFGRRWNHDTDQPVRTNG